MFNFVFVVCCETYQELNDEDEEGRVTTYYYLPRLTSEKRFKYITTYDKTLCVEY